MLCFQSKTVFDELLLWFLMKLIPNKHFHVWRKFLQQLQIVLLLQVEVDLFLNQTDFSYSNKASRSLLSSPVELGWCIGLSPLITWVSVLVQAEFCLTLMVICLSTSPSCHTATQWQNLVKVQDLIGEELSQASSALAWLCDCFVKCRFMLAFSVLISSYVRTGSWCSWALAGRAGGGVEFASLGALIGLDYSQ